MSVLYKEVLYNFLKYSTVKHCVKCTVQVQYNTVQYCKVQCSTVMYSTISHTVPYCSVLSPQVITPFVYKPYLERRCSPSAPSYVLPRTPANSCHEAAVSCHEAANSCH